MDTFIGRNLADDQEECTSTLLAFDESQSRSLALSVRATALVFEDPVSRRLLEQIERIAPSDATVLIIGETGTGKELVARHIHALSKRSKNIFGALNCAALSENLIESELFGHEKGSFTGALTSKDGWFETANKGSLFLDEVGDLPFGMQAKLLRVLQEREVVKVGSRQPVPVDVRIIAATNVNLEEAVAASHFRADLYYRFNVATIQLSPLRERLGDILPLARHFLKIYGDRLGYSEIKLSPATELTLLNYDWPGNIRELENAVHRALLVCPGNRLRPEDFKLSGVRISEHGPSVSTSSLENALQRLCEQAPPKLFEIIEETVIRAAFEFCEENQVQTARLLDISRNVLRHKLGLYGMLPNAQKKLSGAYTDTEVCIGGGAGKTDPKTLYGLT
ncbi:MAG: sigma-54 dependent transcriptional regulator [Methylobacter sp.]|nr:sigma-54 dependent transcriptional regulator [Methylobacter sp.]